MLKCCSLPGLPDSPSFSFWLFCEFLTLANYLSFRSKLVAEKQSLIKHQNSINDARRLSKRSQNVVRIASNVVDMLGMRRMIFHSPFLCKNAFKSLVYFLLTVFGWHLESEENSVDRTGAWFDIIKREGFKIILIYCRN